MAKKPTKAVVAPKGRKVARVLTIAAAPMKADLDARATPKQIRDWWPADRAKRILQIMKDDAISYSRAVARSRRRMTKEMG